MATDTTDDPIMPSSNHGLADAYEPEEIVLPVHDILDPVVGSLIAVEVGLVDAQTFAWAGVDATGSLRSGTMRAEFEVGEDERSITIAWRVEVDDT